VLQGEVPNPAAPPSGCHFHPRCRYATDLCADVRPSLTDITPGHSVACHHAADLSLYGVEDGV
jgi:peptide/nickel transport system ATP-binding protein